MSLRKIHVGNEEPFRLETDNAGDGGQWTGANGCLFALPT
jgi:hypothetical protein